MSLVNLQDKIDEAYPRFYDYEVDISKEQWRELLQDSSIFHEDNLEHMKCLYSFDNHAATCKEVSRKLGKTSSYYVGLATGLAKRIAKKLEIENLQTRDRSDGDVYWYILFYGQEANDRQRGSFEWKLRPALAEALKELFPDLEYPQPMILKKLEDVTATVWLATGILAFETFHQFDNPTKEMMYFKQSEIQKRAQELCKQNVDSARISQWCNADHHTHTYNYLREGEEKTRRLSYFGEFNGVKEHPDLNAENFVQTAIGTKAVTEIIRFISTDYTALFSNEAGGEHGGEGSMRNGNKNMILYGPPGTGKTYNTVSYAVSIIENKSLETIQQEEYAAVLKRYASYKSEGQVAFTTFHQSYGYEEFIEGIKPVITLESAENSTDIQYEYASGIFKKFCDKAQKTLDMTPYVFIIDEINRGNISKIFGELITLIEPTKRLGEDEAATAILPYTGDEFGVPKNVYIIGTMNTADRSIALMDTALRRRFTFIEMMPDINVLKTQDVNGIDVPKMLKTINERIEYLYDREHTIGHAYFTSLAKDPSLDNLAGIFLNALIPLLQEYFYEDYGKIQLVFGDNAKENPDFKFILDTDVKVKEIFKGNPDIDLPEKKYTIQTKAFYHAESYKLIY